VIVGGVNAATVASAVWSAATRSLTNLSLLIQGNYNTVHGSLAASTNVDLRPGATQLNIIVVGSEGGSNAIAAMYDGTTFRPVTVVNASAFTQAFYGNSAFGGALQNTGAAALPYDVCGWKWQI